MSDVLSAMAISGGILLGVLVFVVLVTIVVVKRSEAAAHEDAKHGGNSH